MLVDVGTREPYSSDLSDEAWELIRPVITAWKARHPSVSGHAGRYEMREIVNAILYQARTGCQWRLLPHDLPPKSAVYYYFAIWRDDGTAETIHDLLRRRVREMRRRHEDPTAVVLDSQTVRASTNAPRQTTGFDPGKKSPGRKRGIATDVLGLAIAVVVVAAGVRDNAIGTALLGKVAASAPMVTKAWADAGFKNTVVGHGAPSVSTSRSSGTSRAPTSSPYCPGGGPWSRPGAPRCRTGGRRVTTRPDRPAQWR